MTIREIIIKLVKEDEERVWSLKDLGIRVREVYLEINENECADPERQIRILAQEGILFKPKKGYYKYNCDKTIATGVGELFAAAMKKEVLKKYDNRCIICGNSTSSDLAIDHLIPYSKGGKNTLENAIVLCTKCNNKKKDKVGAEEIEFFENNKKDLENRTKILDEVIEKLKK